MSPLPRLHGEHPGPGLLVVAVGVPSGRAGRPARGLAGGSEKISSSAETGQADIESPEEELVVELGEERLNMLLAL